MGQQDQQDFQVDGFPVTSSEEWSDADLYVGSLWKAVLTILQAQELLQLVDQWKWVSLNQH